MHKNDKSVVIGCRKCSFVVEEARDDKQTGTYFGCRT